MTIKDIQKSACAARNPHLTESKQLGKRKPDGKKSAAIRWLNKNLWVWCKENNLALKGEFEFAPGRKYRADYAIESLMLLIEYEGGVFMEKSGHNTAKGIQRDIDKYQLAHELGYTVLRFTALTYKTALQELDRFLNQRHKQLPII